MHKKAWLKLALFAGLAVAAVAGESRRDLDRIQGAWEVVALTERGKKVPENETKLLDVVVADDRLVIKEDGKVVAEYRIKLDERKKPKTLDMVMVDGKEKEQVAPGIYVLEGDHLKLCVDEDCKSRPTTFGEEDAKTCSLIELKRKAKN
jgi:uncharacterized protein (TIGR03067 family)